MRLLVFWPRAGAFGGASAIRPPCAQILWCELYVMKEGYTDTKENGRWWVYCRLDNVYIRFDYEVGVTDGNVGEAEHKALLTVVVLK